jgi:hypothetical protein
MERAIAYVDGYGLEAALRTKGWQSFCWLDIPALARRFLDPGQELMFTRYYNMLVEAPDEERHRQAVFLDALQTLPGFLGNYVEPHPGTALCKGCGREIELGPEKSIAVELTTDLLADAAVDRFDAALLVSAEDSLAGPVTTARRLLRHRPIAVVSLSGWGSLPLQQAASSVLHLGQLDLRRSQLPDRIEKEKGVVLRRPEGWGSAGG